MAYMQDKSQTRTQKRAYVAKNRLKQQDTVKRWRDAQLKRAQENIKALNANPAQALAIIDDSANYDVWGDQSQSEIAASMTDSILEKIQIVGISAKPDKPKKKKTKNQLLAQFQESRGIESTEKAPRNARIAPGLWTSLDDESKKQDFDPEARVLNKAQSINNAKNVLARIKKEKGS